MNISRHQLEERREQILQQIRAIDRLRRGSLSRQFFKKRRAGSKDPQGPYFVLQGYVQGKKFSERIPAGQAPQIEPLVANYKRFEELAEEFVAVTDQLTRQSQAAPDAKKTPNRSRPGTIPGSQRLHPVSSRPVAAAGGAQPGGGGNWPARGPLPRCLRDARSCPAGPSAWLVGGLLARGAPGALPRRRPYVAVDGTGVPMRPEELQGRAGKQPDGSAKTREAKLACVFTQTTVDEEGLPLRDFESSSYVAGFEEAPDWNISWS